MLFSLREPQGVSWLGAREAGSPMWPPSQAGFFSPDSPFAKLVFVFIWKPEPFLRSQWGEWSIRPRNTETFYVIGSVLSSPHSSFYLNVPKVLSMDWVPSVHHRKGHMRSTLFIAGDVNLGHLVKAVPSEDSTTMLLFFPLHTAFVINWTFVSPTSSCVEILNPNVMVLGSGSFGRWSGYKGGFLMGGIGAVIKAAPEN